MNEIPASELNLSPFKNSEQTGLSPFDLLNPPCDNGGKTNNLTGFVITENDLSLVNPPGAQHSMSATKFNT
jgi:hypothetical protein